MYKFILAAAVLLTPVAVQAHGHGGGVHVGGHVGGFGGGVGFGHHYGPVYSGPYYPRSYYRPYVGFGFGYYNPYYYQAPVYRPYYVPVPQPVYVPAPAPRVVHTHVQLRLNGMREQTRDYVDVNYYGFGNRRVPVINGYVPEVSERTAANGDRVIIYDYQGLVSLADVKARGGF